MDLRRRWWTAAFSRPHVFVLPWPGSTPVRLAAEAFLRRQGWPLALSPADADILLVTAPDRSNLHATLADAADRIWAGIPAPRARAVIDNPALIEPALGSARAELVNLAPQLAEARSRIVQSREPVNHGDTDHDRTAHADTGHVEMGHADMGHSDMGHGDMPMPSGRPLAGEGEDRDGLNLDQLRIALGPALPHWPAGLQLGLTVQGDIVAAAEVGAVGSDEPSWWASPRTTGIDPGAWHAAHRLDSLTRLFALAGADALALRCARIRDDILDRTELSAVEGSLARMARRARRNVVLRSMTGRIPLDTDGTIFGLRATGDVAARWLSWLDEAAACVGGEAPGAGPGAGELLAALPGLVTGRELAEVRLIVAALDPDLDELAGSQSPVPDPTDRPANAHV